MWSAERGQRRPESSSATLQALGKRQFTNYETGVHKPALVVCKMAVSQMSVEHRALLSKGKGDLMK